MDIAFHGATGFVTGSCFRVTTSKGYNILIDCGLYQGTKEVKERNYNNFPFNPSEIDVVLLTHAHIDHSGLIPKLCKKGFKGKIYTSLVTKDLCSIMLPDSGHIQEMEVERKNRKLKRANKPLLEPIYTVADAEKCINQFVGVSYNKKIKLTSGVEVCFKDAGHILGSSMIELYADDKKIVFSGDIGNIDQPIINDPTEIKSADYIVMESTYGNRFHLETEDKVVQLGRVIKRALRKGGNIIIPAFAIERTQDLIYDLKKLIETKEIPEMDVYIDSPLAIRATEIFCKYPDYYDEEATKLLNELGECILNFPSLKFSLSAQESIKLNSLTKNTIIISASGMCDAGRIKHHLKHNLWRSDATVLFVGYQAQGTLGRKILDGEKLVKIHGEEIAINANIEKIEGFSAHADQKGLVEWVNNFTNKPQKIFLVHGEPDARDTLSKILEEAEIEVIKPELNQTFHLLDNRESEKSFENESKAADEIRKLFTNFEHQLSSLQDSINKQQLIMNIEQLKENILQNKSED